VTKPEMFANWLFLLKYSSAQYFKPFLV